MTNSLETTLAANLTAMTIWFDDQKAAATILAQDPRVRASAGELIARRGPAGEGATRDELLNSPAAARLREVLGPPSSGSGYAGFVVIDRTGRAIGASADPGVGSRSLSERADAVGRALAGKSAVSRPFPSEIPLPDPDGKPEVGTPTMLAAVPIRPGNGGVIAALGPRIRPEAGFTRILQVARFGTTGETYAVDDRGLMLSQSRFDDQIRPLGLLGTSPGGRSMLGLDIRDPGADMTIGFRPTVGLRRIR